MKLEILKDIDALNEKVAHLIVSSVKETLKKSDRYTLVLSGGNTPKKLYQLLISEKFKEKIDWARLHFFWGDERCVPFEDERNNAKMAFDTLLDHVPVVKEHIHQMRTDIKPEQAAEEYKKILHNYFPNPQHTFDMVLLGLGNDAHTLSLFPGSGLVHEKENWVRSFYLPDQKMHRITLTPRAVNAAGCVAFLVSGSEKASALYHVTTGEHDPDLYPAQVIQPFNDNLYWFVDKAAAADLE